MGMRAIWFWYYMQSWMYYCHKIANKLTIHFHFKTLKTRMLWLWGFKSSVWTFETTNDATNAFKNIKQLIETCFEGQLNRFQARLGAQNEFRNPVSAWVARPRWVAPLAISHCWNGLRGSLCPGGSLGPQVGRSSLLPHSAFCRKLLEAFPVSKSGVW